MNFLRSKNWDGALRDVMWLGPWIKPFARPIILGIFFFIITTLTAVGLPRFVAFIVDNVLTKNNADFYKWLLCLGSLIAFKIIADLRYKWMITEIGQKITKSIREDVFIRLGVYPMSFFDKNPSGRLISRCVNDVTNLSAVFTSSFFTVISDSLIIIGSLLMMSTMSWKVAMAVLMVLSPMSIFMLNVTQAQMRWGRELRNIISRIASHAADTMNNLGVLHTQAFVKRWENRNDKLQFIFSKLTTRNILVWGSFSSGHVVAMGIAYCGTVSIGIYQLKHQEIRIGEFIALCTYVGLIFGPFFEISEKLNTLVTALSSVKRLRILVGDPIQEKAYGPSLAAAPLGPVRFENIYFSYNSKPLFQGLTLELPALEVTALVGRTGSGKTTLANLLLGLFPLQSGKITWGGHDITVLTPTDRARLTGQVGQDMFIFTDTLRENLRLWREDITDDKIRELLVQIGLWEKVQALPDGLDTIMRSETLPFSQGERQLLLLTRPLLQGPKLLVFDEATAHLDSLTEERWLTHVQDLLKTCTTLFIAHRLETLKLASQVVVLEHGKIKKIFKKAVGTPVREEDLQ